MLELGLAVRRLRGRPVSALASILTLGCSIGATAATWSLLSAVLLHPLPVESPEQLVVAGLRLESSRGGRTSQYHTHGGYLAIRETGVFDGLAAGSASVDPLHVRTGAGAQPRVVFFASYDYFETLGVRLQIGRSFTSDEDRRVASLTAVLSNRLWRSAFSADPNVLGRQITIQDRRAVVIGVAPRGFRGLDLSQAPDLYMPLHAVEQLGNLPFDPFQEASTGAVPWVRIVGRIHADESIAGTTDRLNNMSIDEARSSSFVLTNVNTAAIPESAQEGLSQFVRLLGTTVVLLLLIGCFTVGMLLLIRTEARRGEFAMCLALGASRGQLARGVAIEGALLAAGGALLALPISQWLFAGIRAFELPGNVSLDLLGLSLDGRVLSATVVGAATATVIVAATAGVFGFSASTADVLWARAGATPRVTRRRTRAALVTAQVAVALVLVTGAGLFARSVMSALSLNPGLDTSRLVTGGLFLNTYGYDENRARLFFEQLRFRLESNPAIAGLSFSDSIGGMRAGGRLEIDGEVVEIPSVLGFSGVDENYFSTVGLSVLRGRDFTRNDNREGAPLVAIVSESLGRLVASGGDPVGHRIGELFRRPDEPRETIRIVGVVPDVITEISGLEPLILYRPIGQQADRPTRSMTLLAADDASVGVRLATTAMREIDPIVTPTALATLDEQILSQMAPQRFGMLVMGALGVIAVLLTVLGIYVLAESLASMRSREMGIRAALGATGRQLGGLVLSETVRLVGLGVVVGLIIAWTGAETIRAFLFQVEPLDPITLVVVIAAVFGLALLSSLRPALRAARVDLARVLREG